MSFDSHALKLYVDGSCLRNPGGPSGFAIWVEYPVEWNRPDEFLEQVGFHESTNNRMELSACIWAHDWVRDNCMNMGINRVQIVTDSRYVHDYWHRVGYWRARGWGNANGRPIENADLWKRLLSIRARLRIRTDIEWTLGKKAPILRAVDKSAKSAARQPTKRDRGYSAGKVGRSLNQVSGAATLFRAAGQLVIIRIYHATVIPRSLGDNKIKFQLFSEARHGFFEKFMAYAQPAVACCLHRHHTYRVQFNEDPKYPIITAIIEEITDETTTGQA
jgi:ribonuclease HI